MKKKYLSASRFDSQWKEQKYQITTFLGCEKLSDIWFFWCAYANNFEQYASHGTVPRKVSECIVPSIVH